QAQRATAARLGAKEAQDGGVMKDLQETEMGGRYRIGFDIGGTFTDFILLDAARSEISLHKCLTTPDDPSVGALQGLGELVDNAGIELSEVQQIVHGTTLVTNALIERRGAKLGL